MSKESFRDWLHHHFEGENPEKLLQEYQMPELPSEFFQSTIAETIKSINIDKWRMDKEMFTETNTKKDTILDLIYKRRQLVLIDNYIRSKGCSKQDFRRWKNKQGNDDKTVFVNKDIIEILQDCTKKSKKNKKSGYDEEVEKDKAEEEKTKQLKIKIAAKKKEKEDEKKKEETKPKKE